MKSKTKTSFTHQIMKNMIIRLTLIILFVSAISSFYLQRELNGQLKKQILTYAATKSYNEKVYYSKANDNIHFVATNLIKQFNNNKKTTFETKLKYLNDGTTRTDKSLFNHQKKSGVYIPNSVTITAEYLNELAVVENVFNKFSNLFFKDAFQLWYVSSKKGYVSFLPSTNQHLYNAPDNFDDTNEFYFRISKEDLNPDRKSVWTRVYEDTNYKRWMISLVSPIYVNDIHIGSIGIDFLLDDLLARIQNTNDIGITNYIIDQVGHVIGHEAYKDKLIQSKGTLLVKDTQDPVLEEIFNKLSLVSSLNESVVLDLKSTNHHIGVSKLQSPPWFLITKQNPEHYSKTIISLLKMAILIAIFSLIFEIFIVYLYIKKEIVIPINNLAQHISSQTNNASPIVLEKNLKGELDIIQKSYNDFIELVNNHEKEILDYQRILEEKVSSRTMELNLAIRIADEAKTKSIYTEKLASLGEMASGIAHEINNPLAIIQLNITALEKMLNKGELDIEKTLRAVAKIDSISDRILDIVHGLNKYSDQNLDHPQKALSLQKIINQAIELTANKQIALYIKIKNEISDEIMIMGIETQLIQVFSNLITNSIDAIESRDKEDRWINIWCDQNQNFLFIYFQDSGDGIPDSVLQKMLTPFFTTKEVGKGTGLGLPIIRNIIEKHGGNLQYDNTRSKTTFVIKIPLIK